jgi:hypothetical protein
MFDSLVANGRNKVVNNIRNYLAGLQFIVDNILLK